MRKGLLFFGLLQSCLALPSSKNKPRINNNANAQKFEWTALGDSYASGVGTVKYVDGRRCLRYDQAYPNLLNDEDLSPGLERELHNVVCSGAEAEDIENYQFYDEDHTNQPNIQYSPRPKFGVPDMATLHAGGDDIDFPGILKNCIVEIFAGNDPIAACKEQRDRSWELLKSSDTVDKIDHLIKKTVDKGRKGPIGDKFKLYVMGYPEFFNSKDEGCNDVTFARTANPKDDGKPHNKMTTELREDFNKMSQQLNKLISDAVAQNKDNGVKFLDLQQGKKFGDDGDPLAGHRFCEKDVKEPDQTNKNLWLWHYPYNEPSNDDTKLIDDAEKKAADGLSTQQVMDKYKTGTDFYNAVFDAVDYSKAEKNDGHADVQWDFWESIGNRARVFHPQLALHKYIKDMIFTAWKADRDVDSTGGPPDPACQGNQVQLPTCKQQHYDPNMKDYSGGTTPPLCTKVDDGDNPFLKINDDKAKQGAADYCASLKSSKVVLDAQHTQVGKPGLIHDAAENGGDLAFSVLFDIKGCPPDKKTTNIDFGAMDPKECFDNFYTYFSQICVIDSTWGSYNKDYTLMGGTWLNDCGMWGMTGQQKS